MCFHVLISLERVYAVLWPLQHRVIRNRVYIYSIIIAWSLGLCAFTLMMSSIYYTNTNIIFFTTPITSFSLISLLLICASYLAIGTRLRFTPPGIESHKRQSAAHKLRLSRTFFIVAALSLVFWLPAFVVYTIYDIYPPCIQSPTLFLIVKALHLANWMINPFVYSFRMPIFKDTLVVWSLGLAAFTLMMLSIYITQTPVFYFFQSLLPSFPLVLCCWSAQVILRYALDCASHHLE